VVLDILRLSLLGGLLGLDGTSVGQFMVSRPIAAGVVAGLVVGDPALGLAVGAILELYLLVSFPTGGARFPEGATATVVAVGTAAMLQGPGAFPLGVALGLTWGQVGGASVTLCRTVNGRLVPEVGERVGPRRMGRVLGLTLALDFVRALLVTATGLLLGFLLLGPLASAWPLDQSGTMALLVVGGAASAGILLNDLGGLRARGGWFALGLAAALVGMSLL
jgi:mannose/fructose/N-acetylgalactosamine-specific phosphotransferase system component IIC